MEAYPNSQRRLTKSEPSEPELQHKLYVTDLVGSLAVLFRVELDPPTQLLYCNGLKDIPTEKLKIAGQQAILRCKRMPFISELREFASEKGTEAVFTQPADQQGKGSAHLLATKEIAQELCMKLTGRAYFSLKLPGDEQLIHDLFYKAALVGYLRRGIDCTKWAPDAKELKEFV